MDAAGQDSDPGSCRREQSTCSLAEAIWAGEIATYQCAFSREKADARSRAQTVDGIGRRGSGRERCCDNAVRPTSRCCPRRALLTVVDGAPARSHVKLLLGRVWDSGLRGARRRQEEGGRVAGRMGSAAEAPRADVGAGGGERPVRADLGREKLGSGWDSHLVRCDLGRWTGMAVGWPGSGRGGRHVGYGIGRYFQVGSLAVAGLSRVSMLISGRAHPAPWAVGRTGTEGISCLYHPMDFFMTCAFTIHVELSVSPEMSLLRFRV